MKNNQMSVCTLSRIVVGVMVGTILANLVCFLAVLLVFSISFPLSTSHIFPQKHVEAQESAVAPLPSVKDQVAKKALEAAMAREKRQQEALERQMAALEKLQTKLREMQSRREALDARLAAATTDEERQLLAAEKAALDKQMQEKQTKVQSSRAKVRKSRKMTHATASGGGSGNLPYKLTSSDLRGGLQSVKGEAKACGGKHGARGEKITVILSIAGATGRVTSATAQGAHAGTTLGNCVAAALKKASFKRFEKQAIGFSYSIRM